MLNFLGYIIFSSYEYCGIFLLMLSIFNCDVKENKKEFFVTIFLVTVISYVFTLIASQYVVLIITPLLIISVRYFFKEKIGKSFIIVLGGSAIYLAIQFGISRLAIHLNYLNINDLTSAFEVKSYVMQTLSSTIAITISIYLRIFHGGFGFSLKGRNKPYRVFLYTTMWSFMLSIASFLSFSLSKSISLLTITTVMFIVSSVIVIFLSYNRDRIEYT